jgi:hypothetical protein
MKDDGDQVQNFMTPREKIVLHKMSSPTEVLPHPEYFLDLMLKNKIEKVPVVFEDKIVALVTLKVSFLHVSNVIVSLWLFLFAYSKGHQTFGHFPSS